MTTNAPTPVNITLTPAPVGPPTKRPKTVPPGPGTTGQIPTAPTPIGPPETAPPPVTPGAGTGQSSGETTAITVPVEEAPVTDTNTNAGTNVLVATPVYIKVLSDGTIITENTRALNFIGSGISITGNSAQANITIVGGGNGSPGGSNTQIQFNGSGSFGGDANLTFNNSTQAFRVGGTISATGNITGNYILGNGSQLTGLPATYGNSNVATLLAGFGSNTVSTTGNVNGGNINGTNIITNGIVSATGNVRGDNLNTAGIVSATGNITGSYFIGNGSQLTGIAASYGNANVAANLAAFGSNPISTTGNVTAGNFIGNVVGGGAGTPTISSATNLDLSAASAVRVIGGGTFRLPSLTTAQIANVIAANGDMIYNSSVNKFQGYENGAWANII